MSVPVPTIDATGLTVPTYDAVLSALQADFRNIFGSDIVITPDSQDGQLLAIMASAIFDGYQFGLSVYQSFSPIYAQGAGLASLVKINGITKHTPTFSTATVTIVGVVGTTITNGVAQDSAGNKWSLPASVVIPLLGSIDVTATCQTAGAIAALTGTINAIATPTRGWQSVTNAAAAVIGQAVETDAALRRRQAVSTATPSSQTVEAIQAAVAAVTGVEQVIVFENATGSTDANGIPAHSVSVVYEGGLAQDIGEAIATRKPPGIQTYGATAVTVTDSRGMASTINVQPAITGVMHVTVTVHRGPGYVSSTATLIKRVLAAYFNAFAFGEDSRLGSLYSPCNLQGAVASAESGMTQAELDALAGTYYITALIQARGAGSQTAADVLFDYNEVATGDVANMTVTET